MPVLIAIYHVIQNIIYLNLNFPLRQISLSALSVMRLATVHINALSVGIISLMLPTNKYDYWQFSFVETLR